MYITNVVLNEDWVKLEDLIAENVENFTFSAGNTYFLQTDANDAKIRLAEVSSDTELSKADGLVLRAGQTAEYIKASAYALYARKDDPLNATARILISQKEA